MQALSVSSTRFQCIAVVLWSYTWYSTPRWNDVSFSLKTVLMHCFLSGSVWCPRNTRVCLALEWLFAWVLIFTRRFGEISWYSPRFFTICSVVHCEWSTVRQKATRDSSTGNCGATGHSEFVHKRILCDRNLSWYYQKCGKMRFQLHQVVELALQPRCPKWEQIFPKAYGPTAIYRHCWVTPRRETQKWYGNEGKDTSLKHWDKTNEKCKWKKKSI